MAHVSSVAAIAEAVRAVIMEKTEDHLHGHPKTENVDQLESKIANACASICTTAWGGCHSYQPLALPDAALSCTTGSALINCNLLHPRKVNSAIKKDTSAFDQLALKADQDVLWTEWWTQLEVTIFAVELIVFSIDVQYIEELEGATLDTPTAPSTAFYVTSEQLGAKSTTRRRWMQRSPSEIRGPTHPTATSQSTPGNLPGVQMQPSQLGYPDTIARRS